MIQQEQLAQYHLTHNQHHHDLEHLWEDKASHSPFILAEEHPPLSKTSHQQNHHELDPSQELLNRSLLENEDSNCLFPEKLLQEAVEEDSILINLAPSTTTPSPPLSNKKQCKIDRNAYLEETRAAKIERYLTKKKRRIWDRKIFYDCRKVVADNRERINGRFVKKSPIVKSNSSVKITSTTSLEQYQELQILKEFELDRGGLEDCYL